MKIYVQSKSITGDTLYKTRVGQHLEILLLSNPYQIKIGSTLNAQILFMGKPLPNKIIFARNRIGNQPSTLQKSKTNIDGICTFILNKKGNWFIHTTHMIACSEPAEAD